MLLEEINNYQYLDSVVLQFENLINELQHPTLSTLTIAHSTYCAFRCDLGEVQDEVLTNSSQEQIGLNLDICNVLNRTADTFVTLAIPELISASREIIELLMKLSSICDEEEAGDDDDSDHCSYYNQYIEEKNRRMSAEREVEELKTQRDVLIAMMSCVTD